MIKNLVILVLLLSLVAFLSFVFLPLASNDEGNVVNDSVKAVLMQLGDTALKNKDVPVASVLVYNDNIVATGYNTVMRDNNMAGHAEINAINSLLRQTGIDSFRRMKRSALTLISTWEPCAMCTGAIAESGIENVFVLKPKSWKPRFKQEKQLWLYRWRIKTLKRDTVQMHLFRKHPDFSLQDTNDL